jgi:predicted metal-dependent hydrolase
MTTTHITVSGIPVQIDRKAIKNLHVGVYPPDGRVRLAVPLTTSDDAARLAVVSRLGWIKRHQKNFQKQPRQSAREMVNGESHYIFGKRYLLEVVERHGRHEVEVCSGSSVRLYVRPGATTEARRNALERWYRQLLSNRIPDLIARWGPRLGVKVAGWAVRRMKTKWGSCNIETARISLNTELARIPEECLEYVVVHEMVHLLERHHSDRFRELLDIHFPRWKTVRGLLGSSPLIELVGDEL